VNILTYYCKCMRVCTYRRENCVSHDQPCRIVYTLAGSKFFFTLDLKVGTGKLKWTRNTEKRWSFVHIKVEFNAMLFGLCNASVTFHRFMDMVLTGLQWNIYIVYTDDIIIAGKTFDEHLRKPGLKIFYNLKYHS